MLGRCPSCVLPCPAQPSLVLLASLFFLYVVVFVCFVLLLIKSQFFLQQLSPRSHPLPNPDRNGLKTCSKVCNKEAHISNEVGLLQNDGWIRNLTMKQFHNQLQRKTSQTLFFFFLHVEFLRN